MFFDEIVKYLKCFCHKCKNPLIRLNTIEEKITLRNDNDFKYFFNLCKSTKQCFHCGEHRFDISGDTVNYEIKLKSLDEDTVKYLTATEVFHLFSEIKDDVLEKLGLDVKMVHPKNFIMCNFPIMPPCARPCVNEIGNSTCDDDLTGRIIDIVKVNNNIKAIKKSNPPET